MRNETQTGEGASLSDAYATRLEALQTPLWKKLIDVQAPYRWNVRRLCQGTTLDVGCGIGRNLAHLGAAATGVDPNEACVGLARQAGHSAFLPKDLPAGLFDNLLFAHVLEHVSDPVSLVADHMPRLKPGGRLILFTPQEAGYASDETHIRFLDLEALTTVAKAVGCDVESSQSFPFPRWAGRVFKYNEFVLAARKQGT